MKDEDLMKILDLYEGVKPSAGFKTRVLASIRKPKIIRYLVPFAAAAGILIAVFVINNYAKTTPPIGFIVNDEEEINQNMELLANYEVVQCVDLVEDEKTMKNLEEFVQ